MISSERMPAQLSLHGLKSVAESKNLAKDMQGTNLALQVVDVSIFSADKAKKNIKGRVTLSDGFSKVICMLPDKTYNLMVSASTFFHWPVTNAFFDRLPMARRSASMTSGSSMLASSSALPLTTNRKLILLCANFNHWLRSFAQTACLFPGKI